ncbi:MAG: hypothetical protein M3203_02615 [Actinomycetota bacterium]|nr:hypothetical protein [Actinomycetota bacterium]
MKSRQRFDDLEPMPLQGLEADTLQVALQTTRLSSSSPLLPRWWTLTDFVLRLPMGMVATYSWSALHRSPSLWNPRAVAGRESLVAEYQGTRQWRAHARSFDAEGALE